MKNPPNAENGKLESLLDAVDAAVLTIDSLGIIQESNSATTRLFGYASDQLLGQNVKMLMPSPYKNEHDGYLKHHRDTGENRIIGIGRRVEGRHVTGRVFPIHLSVAEFKENGNTFYTGILHDLTELARVEAESQKLERIIDECINEVFTFHENSLLMTTANQAALDNLGYSSAEIQQITPLDLVEDLSEDALRSSMQKLRNGDVQYLAFDEKFQRKDGSLYETEVQLYYLDELDPPEFATIAMDVTDRNRMLASLRQGQRMESIGNLTGGIAHDFNNILTVVLGNCELMQLEDRSEKDRELLTEVTEAAQMASRLTNRLLAFARRKSLSPDKIDLNQLIQQLYSMLGRLLDNPIQLILALDSQPCWVDVDVSELENSLVNLVVNARDAMPEGGKIALETSHISITDLSPYSNEISPGQYIKLSVSDNGKGIDAAIKDAIFEPFVSTKAESKGTGLGLSMVYGFVKQSGGHIKCYSDQGLGTTFTIYLPGAEDVSAIADTNTGKSSMPVNGKRILVAEDDNSVRRLTTRRLEILGHTVVSAANGHAALELFRESQNFDLVFTDVIMTEGMNGYDLATLIKEIDPDMPVLLTSGYAENVINASKLSESGLSLLRKPYEQNELVDALNRVFDESGMQ